MHKKTWRFTSFAPPRRVLVAQPPPTPASPCYDEAPETTALRFVGDTIWLQRDHQLARFDGETWTVLPPLPRPMTWSQASPRWLVFREGAPWSFAGHLDSGQVVDVWVWSVEEGRWHVGPWPSDLPLLIEGGTEPEDQVYRELVSGTAMAIDGNDRHPPPLFGTDPWRAVHDGVQVDWRHGGARFGPALAPLDDFLDAVVALQGPKPVWFDPYDPEPPTACGAEAVAFVGDQTLWVQPASENWDRRAGLAGVGEEVVAFLTPSWRAAAIHPGRQEVALVSRHSLLVASLTDPSHPGRVVEIPAWRPANDPANGAGDRPQLGLPLGRPEVDIPF